MRCKNNNFIGSARQNITAEDIKMLTLQLWLSNEYAWRKVVIAIKN